MAELLTIPELGQTMPPRGRIGGLDVGSKTIGVAITDIERRIATPHELITRNKLNTDIASLQRIIKAHSLQALIIGYPINMDGTEGPRCQSIRQFAQNILPHITIPLAMWDERMSTMAANRVLLEADVSRSRRKELVDKTAAAFILQGALDALAYQK